MDWKIYVLCSVIALLTCSAALFAYKDSRTGKPRRILALIAALVVPLTLSTDIYIRLQKASTNLVNFNPNSETLIITDQNKAQVKYQAQTDLIQLLSPLRAQYDKSRPGDYLSFQRFKQQRWLDQSHAKTEYYIALAAANQKFVAADQALLDLIKGFGYINHLSALMEQDLSTNGTGGDVNIMTMRIENLL